MIGETDKKIIRLLSDDLPLESEPFKGMAQKLGIDQKELLERIACLEQNGSLRRVGAALKHTNAGYCSNVMVVWNIDEKNAEHAGGFMADQREVSHCYQREHSEKWQYNLYTMIHGKSEQECETVIRKIADNIQHNGYKKLYTIKELKKTSAKYYSNT
ncbi:MAG: putative transcriptional regulator, AsnC family [Oscillospiraceae bacterium]|nr:putative transcriptional regulator, AsnC family [Oscillospiraceae bacterium]